MNGGRKRGGGMGERGREEDSEVERGLRRNRLGGRDRKKGEGKLEDGERNVRESWWEGSHGRKESKRE